MVNDLHYDGIKFPVSGKDFGEIEKGNNISINAFCYEKKIGLSYSCIRPNI